jgi:hypothetical protein
LAWFSADRIDQAVLPQRNVGLDAPHHLLVGGDGHVLDQRAAIVAVHDGKAVLQAQLVALLAQDLHAQRVEGGHRQLLGLLGLLEQLGDTLLHFQRRLVGEGQRGDGARVVAAVFDQVGDFLRDHAGLARAGAGQHQAWTIEVGDSLALRQIKAEYWNFGGHSPTL